LPPNEPNTESNSGANLFFATMYLHQLNRSGIFGPRLLFADVTSLEGPHLVEKGRHVIYVCSGSELIDRKISLLLDEDDRPASLIPAVAKFDIGRFPCSEPVQTLPRYLAYQRARFGLAKEGFEKLYGTVEPGNTTPPRVYAKFQVAPKNYMPG
jgi:hypothetical protein